MDKNSSPWESPCIVDANSIKYRTLLNLGFEVCCQDIRFFLLRRVVSFPRVKCDLSLPSPPSGQANSPNYERHLVIESRRHLWADILLDYINSTTRSRLDCGPCGMWYCRKLHIAFEADSRSICNKNPSFHAGGRWVLEFLTGWDEGVPLPLRKQKGDAGESLHCMVLSSDSAQRLLFLTITVVREYSSTPLRQDTGLEHTSTGWWLFKYLVG
jgi:hypothetical protein